MRVAIVSTGEELLLGLTENSNFGEIARRLREHDHEVVVGTVVGDDLAEIADAMRAAAARADAVVVTGGLGPTRDDLTRDAAAAAAGVEVRLREEQVHVLEERFRALGRSMPPANRVQARFPEGAEVIDNPLGTAPGFVLEVGGARLFALSGVPREMRRMLEEGVLPRLGGGPAFATAVVVRRLKVFGLAEADLDRNLGRLAHRDADPLLGLTAADGVLTVAVASKGERAAAERRVREGEAKVRGLLGDLVYGLEDETLEEAADRQLRRTGLTLAVAESCTGGLVASRLVGRPGVSERFLEGVVAYANEAKVRLLGVREETLAAHGAVSPEVAIEMAEGIRRASGADVGVSTTGIAGPTGGTPEKPVGLVYTGMSIRGRTIVDRKNHFGNRWMVRDRAAKTVFDLLRRLLSWEKTG